MNDAVKNLNELKQKEAELSQKTLEKNADNKQLNEEQKQIQEKMEAISKELKDLDKKNNELEKPNELPNTQQKQQDAKENMEQSQESLEKKKNKNASEKQKKAAQDMKEMADQLQAAQEKMEEQQEGEDMDALRDILENLVHLSFDQEALMLELNSTARENPNYIKLIQRQKKLKDDADMIEDSLLALSKRNPQIKSVVNKEISAINLNMEKAIDAMVERQIPETQNRQQFSMTSVNNLALMLNEALQNMQQKARQKSNKPGNGSCKNPGGTGGKKPSMAKLRQQQEELNQKMDKIRQQLEKNGKQPGKSPQNGQKGGTGTGGNGNLSMEIAKMAAQQESIRRELQKMMKNKDGKGVGGNLAQQMEETETDLVNKRITPETIRRQKEILTRLLESEKAERERELDEQRQSNESKNENFSNPNEFLEYNRLKQKEVELLKTIPLHLAPFYKNKVTQYFNQLDER